MIRTSTPRAEKEGQRSRERERESLVLETGIRALKGVMTSPRSDAVYVADLAPNVQFSSSVTVPTLIKVRKKVEIPGLPLKLSAGLDYNFEKEDVNWVASLKVSTRARERASEQSVLPPFSRARRLTIGFSSFAGEGPRRQGDPGSE